MADLGCCPVTTFTTFGLFLSCAIGNSENRTEVVASGENAVTSENVAVQKDRRSK